jgi:hypothetical protein
MMRRRHIVTIASRASSGVTRSLLAAVVLAATSCGGKAGANEMAMDTGFLRDTAAGDVVLDSLGRPLAIYENEEDSSDSRDRDDASTSETRRSTGDDDDDDDNEKRELRRDDDDDDDDRPRRRGKKDKKGKRGKH